MRTAIAGTLMMSVFAAPTDNNTNTDYSFWKKRGCSHGHSSRVSYRSESRLLSNHRPLNNRRIHKVRHYYACSTTPKKSIAIRRHVRRIYHWRRSYPHIYAIRFARYSYLYGQLASIATCESHGSPTAIGGGGAYRGKYQFSYSTWASVGGSGDPAVAHEWEQDYRAALLLSSSGPGHWPACSQ